MSAEHGGRSPGSWKKYAQLADCGSASRAVLPAMICDESPGDVRARGGA
eukprot:CAMPEP_0184377258 /NCGR_PEP_ID=MMETSP0007-20130409/2128_1 /TAXON_ID=97485 /ORGANISM="Prymnesium parvum, Strain Texoma1" /LENGTH=48 /DNA_ID= /DNA_START= /DNA_END= /DNA_ORIENTATION=